jgi:NAD+ synthase
MITVHNSGRCYCNQECFKKFKASYCLETQTQFEKACANKFVAELEAQHCIEWIKKWFAENGPESNAVIGISGGLDSAVVAALCLEAIGRSRIKGIMMPNGMQSDIEDALLVGYYLKVQLMDCNIESSFLNLKNMICKALENSNTVWGKKSEINTPARLRSTVLYAIAGTLNGRVSNNTNLSERFIGYTSKGECGDFAPLWNFTKTEVRAIAKVLQVPQKIIDKSPADGLCGKTDEENFGFSYSMLDTYIERKRQGLLFFPSPKENTIQAIVKIKRLHEATRHKYDAIPSYQYSGLK